MIILIKLKDDAEAQRRLTGFVEKWQTIEPKAVETFQRDIELTLTFYQFDESLYPRIRTSNLLERLFEEFRRKSDEIGRVPKRAKLFDYLFPVLQRDHAKHDRSGMAKN